MAPGEISGEATPNYMFWPGALERLKKTRPHSKLIAILRNPVERAISHYFHEVHLGREKLPIRQAFAREQESIVKRCSEIRAVPDDLIFPLFHFSYKARSLYAPQIERCLRLFDRSQLMVVKSEDLFQDPRAVLRKVYQHLEVDEDSLPNEFPVANQGHYGQSVPEDLREQLEEYFSEPNQRLAELLGREPLW